ncbi:hypothetical protein GIB67_018388 [Kingdonia uniflora]|uniref:WPP domain-associated protein n=1 Tax=Kingdonia uniflora TaxID=39325 RepID=A0A7J7MJB2_9MAGN|nr:hypothetical protein GIB67_018388 [Kingdonia uniflora]
MENLEIFDNSEVPSSLVSDNSMQQLSNGFRNDDIGDNILDDLESYLKDIDDRLTISRMVSDSVIKGMVNAVMEESAEKIAFKKIKIESLEARLRNYEMGMGELGFGESLNEVRISANRKFQLVEKEIEKLKRRYSKESEPWEGLDKTVCSLKRLMNDLYECSKNTFFEWQKEREFEDEIKDMVIRSSVKSLQEDFEGRLREEQKLQSRGNTKIIELTSLRVELDAISRSLTSYEMAPNGSHEGDEEWNKKDHFRRKGLGSPKSTKDEDVVETTQLDLMSKDKVISYFQSKITKMKRNHETEVHDVAEEYFRLRREFLKERGRSSSLSLRKEKELEFLRKKIPNVILKLDDILIENEKLPPKVCENTDNISHMKERIDILFSENFELRASLTSKEKEVERLMSRVSDSDSKMSRYSLAEASLVEQINYLKCEICEIEDTNIELSIREDIYKCIIVGLICKIRLDIEDLDMETRAMLETCGIVFGEVIRDATTTEDCDINDSYMESIFMKDMSELIFREALKDAEASINVAKMKYEKERRRRVSLEAQVSEANEERRMLHDSLQKKEFIMKMRDEEEVKKRVSLEALVSKANEERRMLCNSLREKENTLSLVEAKEMEHKEQIKVITVSVQKLCKEVTVFECRTMKTIEKNNLRLRKLKFQYTPLTQKANLFKRMDSVYKHKLERRYSDLQKAEAEVDLLGDEVEALLNLLEKIYIALDHYSIILKHYPGVMEVLELIRRELSIESAKQI